MANINLDTLKTQNTLSVTAFERLFVEAKSFTNNLLMDPGVSVIVCHSHILYNIPAWSSVLAHTTRNRLWNCIHCSGI